MKALILLVKILPAILLVVPLACGLDENDIPLDSDCGPEDLTALTQANAISEPCKEAIEDLLPEPSNNLSDQFFRIGKSETEELVSLLLGGSGPDGGPVELDYRDFSVTEYRDGAAFPVDVEESDLSRAEDFAISVSAIIDYSASMTESDIEDALTIYDDFFRLADFSGRIEANHLVFSDEVLTVFEFTEMLADGLEFQDQVIRNGTALLDGMGTGIDALATRENPVRVLLVVTDGLENSSLTFNQEQVIQMANEHQVLIILMGSLFSDLTFFREVTGQTHGFFIYTRKIIDLRQRLLEVAELLQEAVYELTLTDHEADSIEVAWQGQSILYR